MASLGTGELPYAPLQAAVLCDGRWAASHDLRGQPEARLLQALYLPAHLLWPHAALHCGQSSRATTTAAAISVSPERAGELVRNITQAYPGTPPRAPRPGDPAAAGVPASSFLTLASSRTAARKRALALSYQRR